jgi:Uma2 family endonuclease
VYVASPVSDAHARSHSELHFWLAFYRANTSGTVCSIDGTVRLDVDNRPQPDIHLRIEEELGGQARVGTDGYVEGAPELVAEVAYSSVSNDLHDKQKVYRRNLAREYVIWRVEDGALDWFVLRDGTYERLELAEDNTYRSIIFPGLWLDPEALLMHDSAKLIATAQRGLASAEHVAFVEKLAGQMTTKQPAKVEDQAS